MEWFVSMGQVDCIFMHHIKFSVVVRKTRCVCHIKSFTGLPQSVNTVSTGYVDCRLERDASCHQTSARGTCTTNELFNILHCILAPSPRNNTVCQWVCSEWLPVMCTWYAPLVTQQHIFSELRQRDLPSHADWSTVYDTVCHMFSIDSFTIRYPLRREPLNCTLCWGGVVECKITNYSTWIYFKLHVYNSLLVLNKHLTRTCFTQWVCGWLHVLIMNVVL